MTKEELIEFLKDNLSIEIERRYDFYRTNIQVNLLLNNEIISTSDIVEESHY